MSTRMATGQIRDRILDAATELFFQKGIQAVGVDEIVAQAGIAKMTLYKYFLSKDQLILAVLQRGEEQWWGWFDTAIKRRGRSPIRQILAIFDVLAESFEKKQFPGAPFINARIMVADRMYPIYLVTDSMRQRLRDFIFNLARDANLSSPHQIADQLILIISGANLSALLEYSQKPELAAKHAKKMAAALIKSYQER